VYNRNEERREVTKKKTVAGSDFKKLFACEGGREGGREGGMKAEEREPYVWRPSWCAQ
jgi:hypothetical protein